VGSSADVHAQSDHISLFVYNVNNAKHNIVTKVPLCVMITMKYLPDTSNVIVVVHNIQMTYFRLPLIHYCYTNVSQYPP